jgi:hypothetical protein
VFHNEYDLTIRSDTNTRCHTQWFFFSVRNMCKDKFDITNFLKPSSLFNSGMKPCLYSHMLAKEKEIEWH